MITPLGETVIFIFLLLGLFGLHPCDTGPFFFGQFDGVKIIQTAANFHQGTQSICLPPSAWRRLSDFALQPHQPDPLIFPNQWARYLRFTLASR